VHPGLDGDHLTAPFLHRSFAFSYRLLILELRRAASTTPGPAGHTDRYMRPINSAAVRDEMLWLPAKSNGKWNVIAQLLR
jgi:hypothetical protein